MSSEDLADRGIVAGARVGSCRVAHRFGTVEAVILADAVLVRWDDGCRGLISWTGIVPLGCVLDVAAEIAA